MPNPQLRLDAALGLVVIEFRDESGTVTTSIPSQRQLDAYRMWEQQHNAPPATLPGDAAGHTVGCASRQPAGISAAEGGPATVAAGPAIAAPTGIRSGRACCLRSGNPEDVGWSPTRLDGDPDVAPAACRSSEGSADSFLVPLMPALSRHYELAWSRCRRATRWPPRSTRRTSSGWNGAGTTRSGRHSPARCKVSRACCGCTRSRRCRPIIRHGWTGHGCSDWSWSARTLPMCSRRGSP